MIGTVVFTPGAPLTREAMLYTAGANFVQASQMFSRVQRPIYRFTLRLGPLTHTQMVSLSALHAYYQGSRPFYYDGGAYGSVENYSLVADGDGVTRQFWMPNRYIGASSIAVRTVRTGVASNWAASAYSLGADIGRLTFVNSTNTIPASGDEVQAKYGCLYRVNFAAEGLKVQEVAANVYAAEVVLIENVLIS